MRSRALPAAVALVLAGSASGAALQGARSRVATADPVVTTLLLFAATPAGLWRSSSWGASWERVVGRGTATAIDALGAARDIHPKGPQVWVAGDGGLFLSEDFGVTWETLSPLGTSRLLVSRWPEADPTLFAATRFGLLRSRDGGRSFSGTALGAGTVHRLAWPGPELFVASDRGLSVSTDEGAHFRSGVGLPEGPIVAIALSSFFSVDPVLFAAPESGGVFRSGDGGETWSAAGLEGERVRDLVWLGPFLYAAAEGGFFRRDGPKEGWQRRSDTPGRPRRLLFPLAPAAGVEAFLATDRGVFKTNDAGEHWTASGLAGEDVTEIATFPPPETTSGKTKR